MLKWTALVTILTLALYFAMMFRVGLARGKHGVTAPATTGHPDFERAFRVQLNTLEWLPLFLPPLWMTAFYVNDRLAAACGLVWIAGRIVYLRAYTVDPAKRGLGFQIQSLAAAVLYIASIVGIVRAFLGM